MSNFKSIIIFILVQYFGSSKYSPFSNHQWIFNKYLEVIENCKFKKSFKELWSWAYHKPQVLIRLALVPDFHLENSVCKGEGVSSNGKKVKSTNLCLSSSKVFNTVMKGELWQVQKFQTGIGLSKEKLQGL